MQLDSVVLELIACPAPDHAPLRYDEAARTLTCSECGRVFPINEDGVPVLLLDEAQPGPAAGSSVADPEA